MSDETLKLNGFNIVVQKLKENNIDTTQDELSSLFLDSLNDKNSIEVSVFTDLIVQTYGLKSSSDIEEILNALSLNDNISDELSIDDIKIQEEFEKKLNSSEFATLLDDGTKSAMIDMLESIVLSQEEQLNTTKENNGFIASIWDWAKNTTGFGAGSNKAQSKIDDLKAQIEALKKDNSKLAEVYKNVTGNELNQDEFLKLCSNEADFSDSEVINSVSKYVQGQKMSVDVVAGISSALTVTGLIAAGVVAAPFTGGMSLGASLAAAGTLTAAGTAAYMIPQAVDGLSEKDGYSSSEIVEDLASGVVNSAFAVAGSSVGKVASTAFGANATTQAGKVAANFAASEASAVVMGDGIAVGNYLVDVAVDENKDFSLEELATTAAVATVGSLAAGGASFATSSVLNPLASSLTQNSSAQTQVLARFLASGTSGAMGGTSASIAAGSTSYLLNCAVNGKEVNFEDWLDSTTENIATSALTGFSAGIAFEAVQIAAGTPAPNNSVKTKNLKTDDGLLYKDYYDKDGNLIARDIKAADLSNYLKTNALSVQDQSLELAPIDSNSNNSMVSNTRTVRFTFNYAEGTIVQNGVEYDVNAALVQGHAYDWMNNSSFIGQQGFVDVYPNNNQVFDQVQTQTGLNQPFNPSSEEIAIISQNGGLVISNNQIGQTGQFGQIGQTPFDTSVSLQAGIQGSAALNNNPNNSSNIFVSNSQNTINTQPQTQEEFRSLVQKAVEEVKPYSLRRADASGVEKFIDDNVRLIECTRDRLNNAGVKIDENYILDIARKFEFSDTLTIDLSSLSVVKDKTVGNACVINELLNNEIIDFEGLDELFEGIVDNTNFSLAYQKAANFDKVLKQCFGSDYNKISALKDVAKLVSEGKLETSSLKDIFKDISTISANEIKQRTIKAQSAPLFSDKESFDEFWNQIDDTYDIQCTALQNGAGYELSASKNVSTSEYSRGLAPLFNDTSITKNITLNQDGTISKSTTETTHVRGKGLLTKTWYYGQDRTIITQGVDSNINSQIEIVNDESGEPSYILYSKKSDTLEGAYETTKYTLSDYPEDFNVLGYLLGEGDEIITFNPDDYDSYADIYTAYGFSSDDKNIEMYEKSLRIKHSLDEYIEKNGYKEGEKLSSVKSENGITTYVENSENNGLSSTRRYEETKDETGALTSYQYNYDIVNEEGKTTLALNRSWQKNSANSTTTVVNGKTYKADFDDTTMQITITQDGKEPQVLDIVDKVILNNGAGTLYFETVEQAQKAFFEFCKTVPADSLLTLNQNVRTVELVSPTNSQIGDFELKTGLNLPILTHELGHSIDFGADSEPGIISSNQDLIDIYNQEMAEFKAIYPEACQDIVHYFGQEGGGFAEVNTGLSELVAEVNMLMTTYAISGTEANMLTARSEYLVKHFPNTVSMVAKLLGYN